MQNPLVYCVGARPPILVVPPVDISPERGGQNRNSTEMVIGGLVTGKTALKYVRGCSEAESSARLFPEQDGRLSARISERSFNRRTRSECNSRGGLWGACGGPGTENVPKRKREIEMLLRSRGGARQRTPGAQKLSRRFVAAPSLFATAGFLVGRTSSDEPAKRGLLRSQRLHPKTFFPALLTPPEETTALIFQGAAVVQSIQKRPGHHPGTGMAFET